MRLNKQQLHELQEKFVGYTVHAAEQSDKGIVVCLTSKSGQTAVYVMGSLDEAVVPDRITEVNAQVHFCADGFEDVTVDACNLAETIVAEAKAVADRAECAEKALSDAQATIETMKNAENARRLSAAKAKATATLAAFNANREDKVSDDTIKALSADIDAGKFTALTDDAGAWIGETAVEEKVLSLCAAAVMEHDKANAKKAKNSYIWEKLASGEADDGSIEALLARKGIKTDNR